MIIYAVNIHSGGGKILLDELLESQTFGQISHLYHDKRYRYNQEHTQNLKLIPVDPKLISRYQTEAALHTECQQSNKNEDILFFGNIPPIRRLPNKTILYLQNACLFPSSRVSLLPIQPFLRVLYEKLLLKLFIKNCDEVWVQSEWMKEQVENEFNFQSKKVEIKPIYPKLPPPNHSVLKKYDYIHLSGTEPHKRLPTFLTTLKEGKLLDGTSICLILSNSNPRVDELIKEINAKFSKPLIDIYQGITREHVLNLIQSSRTLIVTSEFESFCLPIYEAQHYGLNIMTVDSHFLSPTIPVQRMNTFKDLVSNIEGNSP